ncbi:MAG: hypothetical protein DRG20_05125 [Deltaproteobacteria bacterium]|nr:zinc-ribbon domain-containing protein [Deltaproteobacteria bacterium]RLA89146.1 MAG: hypothetical protein DRG20_05125 [Deltaproteobacteria bacterium]
MKIKCIECGFEGYIPDKKISEKGQKVKCPKCQTKFLVKKGLPYPLPLPSEPKFLKIKTDKKGKDIELSSSYQKKEITQWGKTQVMKTAYPKKKPTFSSDKDKEKHHLIERIKTLFKK